MTILLPVSYQKVTWKWSGEPDSKQRGPEEGLCRCLHLAAIAWKQGPQSIGLIFPPEKGKPRRGSWAGDLRPHLGSLLTHPLPWSSLLLPWVIFKRRCWGPLFPVSCHVWEHQTVTLYVNNNLLQFAIMANAFSLPLQIFQCLQAFNVAVRSLKPAWYFPSCLFCLFFL